MQKLYFIISLSIISMTFAAEEKKPVASIFATLKGYIHPQRDDQGYLLASSLEKRAVFLIRSDAQVMRQVSETYPVTQSGQFFYPAHQNVVVENKDSSLVFYSTDKEFKKLGTLEAGTGIYSSGLKNGNMFTSTEDGRLRIFTTRGSLVAEAKYEVDKFNFHLAEHIDGTLVFSTASKKHYLTPDLKLIKKIDTNCHNRGIAMHSDLNICETGPGEARGVRAYTSKGDIKYYLPLDNSGLNSFASLPNGHIVYMLTDGYVDIVDAEGIKKFSYLHDTKVKSDLILVLDKYIAYWNRTEIVFLDLQAKEVGTLKMPKVYDPDGSRRRLIPLANGNFLAVDGSDFYFIKMLI